MNLPIAVFDSGVGGLTVLREVERLLPGEDLIYFSDQARLPYGSKSPEAIVRSAMRCVNFLESLGIKLLIIACHTASAHLILEQAINMIGPGFELLLAATKTKRVAVLGTMSTIASGVYQRLLSPHVTLFPVACPLFVPLVEERFFDHEATDQIAHHYLHSLREEKIDTVLLACTHYPLLRQSIQKALGPEIQILEPARAVAEEAKKRLESRNLLSTKTKGDVRFYATDDLKRFTSLTETILGKTLREEQISLVHLD